MRIIIQCEEATWILLTRGYDLRDLLWCDYRIRVLVAVCYLCSAIAANKAFLKELEGKSVFEAVYDW